MRGHVSFTFEGKEINLLFNTWAFRSYCDKKGLTLDKFFESLNGSVTLTDYVDLVYSAASSYAHKYKQPVDFDDYAACEWIDFLFYENGGKGFADVNAALIRSVSIEESKEVKPETEEEKKS